jgi:ligand-binding sensor domain-containing protein
VILLKAQISPFFHFTEDDGLPGNKVNDIIKDREGFLWIATDNGVAKFDGDRYVIINDKNGYPLQMTRAVVAGENNVIYAGLYPGGIAVIKNDSVTHIIHAADKKHDYIRKLYYSTYYNMLIAGSEYGVMILHDSVLVQVSFPKAPENPKSEVLSFTGDNSVIYYSIHDEGIYRLFVNQEEPGKSFSTRVSVDKGAYACMIMHDTLYGGSFNQIYRFNAKNPLIAYHTSKVDSSLFIWNFSPWKEGKILIGGLGEERFRGDVIVFSPVNSTYHNPGLKPDFESVNATFYDSIADVTWIARDNGLTALYDSPFKVFDTDLNITDIGFAGDSLLALTDYGVFYFNEKTTVPVLSREQALSKINNSYRIMLNRPDKGAYLFDNSDFFELVSFEQNNRKLFVSTQRGAISVPDLKTYLPFAVGTFMTFNNTNSAYVGVKYNNLKYYPSLKDSLGWMIPDGPGGRVNDITRIVESSGVFYCISPSRGLFALKNNLVFRLSEDNSEIDNNITDIDKDSDGNVWCVAASGILFNIEFSDSLFIRGKTDLIKNGLVGTSCKWIRFNGRHLLIGTNKGLNVLSRNALDSGNPHIEHFYNSYSGFDFISAVSPVCDNKGKIYLHTANEIISIDTNFRSSPAKKIYLSNLFINGNPSAISMLTEKSLTFDQKQISFFFTSIKYPVSKNLDYRYRVNNGEWVRGNQVTLQSLRPGSYKIAMEGLDRDDMTTIAHTLTFAVKPPFWRSAWFILLASLVFSSALIWFIRMRISRIKKQNEERTRLLVRNSELHLRSLQNQMNPHFIFNTINAIQGFIVKKDIDESLKYIGKLSGIIRTNLENAAEEYINLAIETEFLNKYVEIELMRFRNKVSIEIINNVGDNDIMLPPMLIQPLIENAIEHGVRNKNEPGIIKVEFNRNDDILSVNIVDNGAGRQYAKSSNNTARHNGVGLKILTQRLKLLNEMNHTNVHSITFTDLFDDGVPAGTKVNVSLLLKRSQ